MLVAWITLMSASMAAEPLPLPPERVRVKSVYDGDTLTLDTGHKVRLMSVNTPELRPMEPYGEEARDLARSLCLGKEAQISFNPDDAVDGYGRLLASVTCAEGSLALKLLEAGLAHVFLIPPVNEDVAPLLAAQKKARDAKLGIWSTERYRGDLHITSFHANAPGKDEYNLNGEYLRIANVNVEPVDIAGFALDNYAGEKYVFPAMTIPAGHTFRVHSGKGDNQSDPKDQLVVYLNSEVPVWDNGHERARILDPRGRPVDAAEHKSKNPTD